MTTEYPLATDIQTDILKLLVSDPVLATAGEVWIKPEYFGTASHKRMASLILRYFSQYSTPPTKSVCETELNRIASKGKLSIVEHRQMNALIDEIFTKSFSAAKEYTIEHVHKFAKQRSLETAIAKSLPYLEAGDHDKVLEIMAEAESMLHSDVDSGGYWYFESAYERLRRRQENDESLVYPTGIPEIDLNFRRGGVSPGEVALWMGVKGGGKSIGLIHVARRALMQGGKVAFYSFEMSAEQIADRLDSSISGIDMWHMKENEQKLLEKLNDVGSQYPKSLMLKRYPTKSKSIEDIRKHLRTLQILHKWTPDMIIVDYCGIVRPPRMHKDKHVEMQETLESFRALCIEMNAAGWTAAQINRSGALASIAEGTHAAGSWDQLATADHIFVIAPRSVVDLDEQTIRIWIDKIRDGKDHYNVGPFKTNWPCMQFVLYSNRTNAEILAEQEAVRKAMRKETEVREDHIKKLETKKSKLKGKPSSEMMSLPDVPLPIAPSIPNPHSIKTIKDCGGSLEALFAEPST